LWLNSTDCVRFPCAAYELRHSLDLALLTKWPVFLENAFGNPAYVNQTNLNGKLRKKWGWSNGGPSKNLRDHGPPRHPLESPLLVTPLNTRNTGAAQRSPALVIRAFRKRHSRTICFSGKHSRMKLTCQSILTRVTLKITHFCHARYIMDNCHGLQSWLKQDSVLCCYC